MICKDCGQEVDKINKKGRCKQCNTRYSNYKHRNIEYIPLIKLKEIDYDAYYQSMCRRKNYKLVEDKIEKVKSTELKNHDDLKMTYYSKVAKDIDGAFKKNKISKDYLNYKDLDKFIDMFFLLLQDDNFISDAKEGEQIFNTLFNLYKHSQENLSWDDLDKINDISYALKALSELRRPTKELLSYYCIIDPLITYLKADNKFMELLKDARFNIMKKSDMDKTPGYYSELESSLIQDDKFLGVRENKIKLYDCTVWCYNLNGDSSRRLFRANKGIYAKNQADAKLRFKTFLKDKFATLTYKEKDINIEEVDSIEEINKRMTEQHQLNSRQ